MARAEFDGIADVYDDTRRALDAQTLAGVKGAFSAHGCSKILEVGVGTGRVSVPLMSKGFEMTGLDLSKKMMEVAREKGHSRLVLGDGMEAPFKEESFDAVLLAHVIHLVEDPVGVLGEGGRVSRVGVFALLRKREEGRWSPYSMLGDQPGGDAEERRAWFRRLAEKYNWSWEKNRTHDWGRERRLVEEVPPDELAVVSDVQVSESLEQRIARFEKGGYTDFASMPPGMKAELIAAMKRREPPVASPRREVHQLAFWSSGRLRAGAGRGPSGRGSPP